MTKVLIAVDDSDSSVVAAKTARRLFGDDADYTVVNVADDRPLMWGDASLAYGAVYPLAVPGAGAIGGVPLVVQPAFSADRARDRMEIAEQTADEVAHRAGMSDAEAVAGTGDAAEAIVSAAKQHHADVIVVGTHDRGWFKRLFTPSVSDAVLRDTDIPVLVAR